MIFLVFAEHSFNFHFSTWFNRLNEWSADDQNYEVINDKAQFLNFSVSVFHFQLKQTKMAN